MFRTIDEYLRVAGSDLPPLRLILEPEGRNTAPAIGVAARAAIEAHGEDAVLLVLPADHLINDGEGFASAVQAALPAARDGRLVTFGIVPSRAEAGFGYIECGERIAGAVHSVARFIEKPPLDTARAFVDGGRHLWNSGMFCFRARTLLDALETHAQPVALALDGAWATRRTGAFDGHTTLTFDPVQFARLPSVSIDYAVMEKASSVACVRGAFDWSDIGSWETYSETLPADADGNRRVGATVLIGTRNTAVHATDRLVAMVGVDNLVVVDTPDAVLVAGRDKVQAVRELVAELKRSGDERYRSHLTTSRPWGSYTVLNEGPGFKIKRIEVKPGNELSLQLHHRRAEHWVVVRGVAEVTCGERVFPLSANESTYIPVETKHRLANRGAERLVLIEVQCGEHLGEDDNVRFADKYGLAG